MEQLNDIYSLDYYPGSKSASESGLEHKYETLI